MDYQVIDNFLTEEVFQRYSVLATNEIPVFYQDGVGVEGKDSEYYFTHSFYNFHHKQSNFFDSLILPLLEKINLRALIRAQANFYPKTHKITEHEKHVDQPFDHRVLILYVNTCNGFTRLAKDTVVKSVANRAIIFDGNIYHNSTTCTDEKMRRIINVNFV